MSAFHPDDEFHPPLDDDPYRTETAWFTFTVPERRLSGQFYPFFLPNLGVFAGAAYFWNDAGDQWWNCLYAKNFWHLPIPDAPLSNIELPNGLSLRCREALRCYELDYLDPDGNDEIEVHLRFTAIAQPHYLGKGHLDQPGRYEGSIRLRGESFKVDSYGFRDRSWGKRSQFGPGMVPKGAAYGGYTYGTASETHAFHCISGDRGEGCLGYHGYLIEEGIWAPLAEARREVLARAPGTGYPTVVRVTGRDRLGRALLAEGRCLNQLGVPLNPNMLSINCLTDWQINGVQAYGEDHENWTPAAARDFFRQHLHLRKP